MISLVLAGLAVPTFTALILILILSPRFFSALDDLVLKTLSYLLWALLLVCVIIYKVVAFVVLAVVDLVRPAPCEPTK
ncbi:hypothetical protein BGZ98_008160, partial [Dissophora globulifera]